MKKKNWLLTIAFAVLALTIVSTTVLGGTYAKFVSTVNGGAEAQAAGFLVTAGNNGTITASADLIAPGVAITSSSQINYFSQVDTLITISDASSVEFTGPLAEWDTATTGVIAAYNAAHANDGLAVPASLAATNVFVVTGAAGADLGSTFLAALVDAASTANVALTVKTWTTGDPGSEVSHYAVKAMGAEAVTALATTVTLGVKWADNYITSGTTAYMVNGVYVSQSAYDAAVAENTSEPGTNTVATVNVTAQDIMDSFDTYLGGLIYDALQENTPVTTTLTAHLGITATQNTGTAIDWSTTGAQSTTSGKVTTYNNGIVVVTPTSGS